MKKKVSKKQKKKRSVVLVDLSNVPKDLNIQIDDARRKEFEKENKTLSKKAL